jgi:phage-related protein
MSWLSNLFNFFKDAFTGLLNYLKDVYLFVANLVYSLIDSIKAVFNDIVNWVVAAVQWVITGISNFVQSIWNSIVAFVNDAIEWLITVVGKIIGAIVDIIAKAIPVLAGALFSGLGFPLLLVGGVYLWSKRSKKRAGVTSNAT